MGWAEEFGIGLAVGIVLSLGGLATIRWFMARRRGEVPPAEIPAAAFGREAKARPIHSPSPHRPSPTTNRGWPGLAPPSLAFSDPDPDGDLLSGTSVRSPPGPVASAAAQQVALSRRIVLHLFALGRWGPDDVGPSEATQRGICAGLSAEQSAVSKVLRRLEAAAVIVSDRRHVRGEDRRLNVYALTRSGELLAHEILARNVGAGPANARTAYPVHRPGSLPVSAPDRLPPGSAARPTGPDGHPHLTD